MSRAVFINVSAAGHVIPTFGLVQELIERGEEVIYFEETKFKQEIEAFGASFCPFPQIKSFDTVPKSYNELSVVPALTWFAEELLPSLLEDVRAQKPDYIIHDSLSLVGKLVAHLLNVPAVNSISTAAFCPRNFYESPQIQERVGKLLSGTTINEQFHHYKQKLQQAYSIPPIDFIEPFTNPEPLNICYLPPELQPDIEKFDSSFRFVGPCSLTRKMQCDFSFEELKQDKLILISFGTVHDPGLEFYRWCIEAFKDIDAQVLMLIANSTNVEQLENIPANFIIKPTGTIPQLEVLKRTNLFVMHGAAGGTREAVCHGVPTIAIPQTYEQELISHRLVEHGAGVMILPKDVNPGLLHQTAKKILNDNSFRRNSTKLGDACDAAGGAKLAVDEILKYVRTKAVSQV